MFNFFKFEDIPCNNILGGIMHNLTKFFVVTLLSTLACQQTTFAQSDYDNYQGRSNHYNDSRYHQEMNNRRGDFDRNYDNMYRNDMKNRRDNFNRDYDNNTSCNYPTDENMHNSRAGNRDRRGQYQDREDQYRDRNRESNSYYGRGMRENEARYNDSRYSKDSRRGDDERNTYGEQENQRSQYRNEAAMPQSYPLEDNITGYRNQEYKGERRGDSENVHHHNGYQDQREGYFNRAKDHDQQVKDNDQDQEINYRDDQEENYEKQNSSDRRRLQQEQAMRDDLTTTQEQRMQHAQPQTRETLVEVISNHPTLSTFLQTLKAAGIAQTLSNQEPITIFAPSNKAFQKIADKHPELMKPENKQKLIEIIKNHIVAGKINPADLKTSKLHTIGGKELDISINGSKKTVDKAEIVEPDLKATNGVVYIIDTVLVP